MIVCEADVYILEDGEEMLFIKSADTITPYDDRLIIKDIFGHKEIIKARIKELRLVDHQIIIEKI
ncbi:CooT family nickel-binding protein [Mahella australiensis]|uniref:RNA-binding protein, predicted n=1 Tax=Mahella australiensis (strain DSM 15567 / CIP 107919 / 50-1 BON) TaxID=697281 RepID=F3ZYA7_MAHA5|nr:CooT family nickel-binding protein [Mahella australiensis]AEE95632.1 RNA-binding protein, predicted [Mahella australiensis 50-1 BON]